jgi:hypothetical protein
MAEVNKRPAKLSRLLNDASHRGFTLAAGKWFRVYLENRRSNNTIIH